MLSSLLRTAVVAARNSVRQGEDTDYLDDGVGAEDVADLVAVLNLEQAELVMGLYRASDFVRDLLASSLPQGTRELLLSHNAIDRDGRLTQLGVAVARQMAFAGHRGPDPRLVATAEKLEAELQDSH